MQKFHVKRNDEVVIIAGTERGKRGRILQVLNKKERVIIEGAKMIKRHMKKGRNRNAPQGQIIEREGTIHISNVMLAKEFDAKAAKRAPAASTTPAEGQPST
jgi:large subunit ribosomal protein L24